MASTYNLGLQLFQQICFSVDINGSDLVIPIFGANLTKDIEATLAPGITYKTRQSSQSVAGVQTLVVQFVAQEEEAGSYGCLSLPDFMLVRCESETKVQRCGVTAGNKNGDVFCRVVSGF